ncbi:MAG TPA: zinc-dependent metalloprotease, partial [Rhizomicrobium sp.]
VAVIFENPRFRADGGSAEEKNGVTTSFAFVTAAMLDIAAGKPDGSLVVDLAPFISSDVMNVAGMLNGGEAGGFPEGTQIATGTGFKLVTDASAADAASVKVFPDNVEMDALMTFQGDKPGPEIADISPDPRRVSVTIHHSFIRLPGPGFVPRKFDIRTGTIPTQVYDFKKPLGEQMIYQLANRFRLEKIDPNAARSKVKKPIVFYIDNAAPEPVRSALLKGVGWWSQAFDAAGFIDGFQAKILPANADPMDIRYNIVHWSNRLTRSWSYGEEVVDPRTGEIVRGGVVLGGDRARQDTQIFEGLVGIKDENGGGPNDPVRVTLARMSQLGAHEVGHAIGYMHNFAGSTQDRTSVMEYPGPRMKLTPDGKIDLGDAYAVGIGSWDKFEVDWLYGEPPPGTDPDQAASEKADRMVAAGTRFITDIDSRADNTPTPWASMWDDGPDPVAELPRLMKVRAVALSNFGENVLHPGEPLANLRRKFAPIWLLHRYQVIAASKSIGGMDYSYKNAGDGHPLPMPVPNAMQEAALNGILATLDARLLTVPKPLVEMMSSGINGRDSRADDIEVFDTAGSSVFDPLAAADAAAQLTLGPLLEPLRLTRVYEQHARDASLMGVEELLDKLLAATVGSAHDAVGRRIAYRTLVTLARVEAERSTAPDVAALIGDRLEKSADLLAKADDAAWGRSMIRLVKNEALLRAEVAKMRPHKSYVPGGMPIGETNWLEDDWMDQPL